MYFSSKFLVFLAICSFYFISTTSTASVRQRKTIIRAAEEDSESFCYEEDENCGPKHWDGFCNSPAHKHQSPINIQVNPSDFEENYQFMRFSESYEKTFGSFYIENNGHSIQISPQEDDDVESNEARFCYGEDHETYVFSQMHFHWGPNSTHGSEHTINSTSYPMEIHLVHHSVNYDDINEALADVNVTDSLSVLGVFVEEDPDCETSSIFEPIVHAMKTVLMDPSADKTEVVNRSLKPSSFLPSALDFFGYNGSLTTPSCAEAVRWSVIRKPICISPEHLQVFRSIRDEEGLKLVSNHRPVQPLGKRKVEFFKVRDNIDDNNDGDDDGDDNSAACQQNLNSTLWSSLLLLNVLYYFLRSC